MSRKVNQNMLTIDEMRALAGPCPMDNPEFRETWNLRWTVWKLLRTSQHLPKNWIRLQLKTTILGYHAQSYKVIGITKFALEDFAGPNGDFSSGWLGGKYQRAHLYPVRLLSQEMMSMPIDTSMEELAQWVWDRDVVVLSLKEENHDLEDRDYFLQNTIKFSNPEGKLFRDVGSRSAYGLDEKNFLIKLYQEHVHECLYTSPDRTSSR